MSSGLVVPTALNDDRGDRVWHRPQRHRRSTQRFAPQTGRNAAEFRTGRGNSPYSRNHRQSLRNRRSDADATTARQLEAATPQPSALRTGRRRRPICGRRRISGWRRISWRGWISWRRRLSGRRRIAIKALLIFLSTWNVVEAAAAIMNLRGGGKRIAKVATSRGRWCGPHNTSGQGCRCTTDRGHQ